MPMPRAVSLAEATEGDEQAPPPRKRAAALPRQSVSQINRGLSDAEPPAESGSTPVEPAATPTPAATAQPERTAVMASTSNIDDQIASLFEAIEAKNASEQEKAKKARTVAAAMIASLPPAEADKLFESLGVKRTDTEAVDTAQPGKHEAPSGPTTDREVGAPHPDDKDRVWDGKKWVSKEAYDSAKPSLLNKWFSGTGN